MSLCRERTHGNSRVFFPPSYNSSSEEKDISPPCFLPSLSHSSFILHCDKGKGLFSSVSLIPILVFVSLGKKIQRRGKIGTARRRKEGRRKNGNQRLVKLPPAILIARTPKYTAAEKERKKKTARIFR